MLISLLAKGGPIVWIILGLSVVSASIILERVFVLRAIHRVLREAEERDPGSREQLVKRVARCVFEGSGRRRSTMKWQGMATRLADETPEQLGLFLASVLSQRVRIIGIIGHLLPLLGLLGTITGMIRVFMKLETFAAPNVSHLAGGLWEALLTTAVGLAVAIPSLAFYHYLEGRVDELSLRVTDLVEITPKESP